MLYWCCESWLVSSQLEDHCDRRGLNTSVLQGFSVGRQIIWHHDFCPRAFPSLQFLGKSNTFQQHCNNPSSKALRKCFLQKCDRKKSGIHCNNPKQSRNADTLGPVEPVGMHYRLRPMERRP